MPLRPAGTFGAHPLTEMDQPAILYSTHLYYAKHRKWYRWQDTGRVPPLYSVGREDDGRRAGSQKAAVIHHAPHHDNAGVRCRLP